MFRALLYCRFLINQRNKYFFLIIQKSSLKFCFSPLPPLLNPANLMGNPVVTDMAMQYGQDLVKFNFILNL
jgi:hypothetical protein